MINSLISLLITALASWLCFLGFSVTGDAYLLLAGGTLAIAAIVSLGVFGFRIYKAITSPVIQGGDYVASICPSCKGAVYSPLGQRTVRCECGQSFRVRPMCSGGVCR